MFLRTVADPALRRKKHEDHLVWARESHLKADKMSRNRGVYASQLLRERRGHGGGRFAARGYWWRRAIGEGISRDGSVDPKPGGRCEAYHWTIAADPTYNWKCGPRGRALRDVKA